MKGDLDSDAFRSICKRIHRRWFALTTKTRSEKTLVLAIVRQAFQTP